jgi:dTDP-4-dehydrorhamnose 3,5-epimerase
MQITELELPGVRLIQPKRFGDHRGYFAETWSAAKFAEAGLPTTWVQDNESLSAEKGTVRGLHFQRPPHAQAKLIRCIQGSILDVAVDLRQGSPTFGQHLTRVLDGTNGDQLFVPKGFAHGFATLEPDCLVQYKVNDIYAPHLDSGVIWNDPALGIDWQTDSPDAVLSEKDQKLPTLAELDNPFTFEQGS